jgi:hypothetical protein
VRFLLFFFIIAISSQTIASEGLFEIKSAQTHLEHDRYFLDANINYELSEESIRALQNGIALTIVFQIEIIKERWYLWNEKVANFTHHSILRFHPLSNHYVVSYIEKDKSYAFTNLAELLTNLGILREIPLLEKSQISNEHSYQVRLNTYLDIEALPPSLRTVAYFSKEWRMFSDPFNCPLS